MHCLALLLCIASAAVPATQTKDFIPGIFVSSPKGPIELITYAEGTGIGTLHLQRGSFDDVPTVAPAKELRVLAALPLWPPIGVVVATEDLFRSEYAERRTIPFGTRKLNIYVLEMRIADLETPKSVAGLIRAVRGSKENPAYAFIIVSSSGVRRYYPIRLSVEQ